MTDPKDFVKVSTALDRYPCPICGVKGGLVGAGMAIDSHLPKGTGKIWTVTYCQGCENHFMTNVPFVQVKKENCLILPGADKNDPNLMALPEGYEGIEPIMNQKLVLKLVNNITKGGFGMRINNPSEGSGTEESFMGAAFSGLMGDSSQKKDPAPDTPPKTRRRFEL